MKQDIKVAVIGAGALGGSVAEGLHRAGVNVTVSDKNENRLKELAAQGISVAASNGEALKNSDLVLIALKPHLMVPVVKTMAAELAGKLCCSMAAFVDIDLLSSAAPNARWGRAMTNICASVCKAFTGYTLSKNLNEKDENIFREVFSSLGLARSISEADLDGIIGVSGSGPAYVFTILEAFIQGGLASGLRADISLEAAAMTLIGSAELVLAGGEHPASLKDKVCTPAGTTIDALRVIEAGGLRTSIIDGVVTACEKGRIGGEALKKNLKKNI